MCPPVRRADTQVGPYTPRLCGAISESGFTQKPEESNFHMQCCTDWYMNYFAVDFFKWELRNVGGQQHQGRVALRTFAGAVKQRRGQIGIELLQRFP